MNAIADARRPGAANRARQAFTLIELLVVIVILAILAAVVVPRVLGHTDDARISAASTNVSMFDEALETYKLHTGHYPQGESLQPLVQNTENDPKWAGPYIKGSSIPNDPWGHPYMYQCPSQHGGDFDVWSAGPDGQSGSNDDIGNWNLQK